MKFLSSGYKPKGVQPIADELWVIRGTEPVLWTLPVYVTWQTPEWGALFYGVEPFPSMRAAVQHVLQECAQPMEGAMWRIRRLALEKIGEQKEFASPDLYFSWEKPRGELMREAAKNPEKVRRRQEVTDFLDALHQKGVGRTREELEYMWKIFCEHAADWMVNKQRPVDMYLWKLHISPYRANWKQIILGRFPELGRLICHCTDLELEYFSHKSGLTDELLCLDLLAMDKRDAFCYRSVEVEHKGSWWRKIRQIEQTRITRTGPVQYAADCLAAIKRRLKITRNLYVEWLEAVARPSAADVECGRSGEFRLVPNVPPRDLPPLRSRKSVYVPSVVSSTPLQFKGAGDPEDLYPPAGGVPEVSLVERPRRDVWNRRTDLHRSADGGEPAPGVPLLYGNQKPAAGELLAVDGDGQQPGSNGMARRTEP